MCGTQGSAGFAGLCFFDHLIIGQVWRHHGLRIFVMKKFFCSARSCIVSNLCSGWILRNWRNPAFFVAPFNSTLAALLRVSGIAA
jgi:hypothetical protein